VSTFPWWYRVRRWWHVTTLADKWRVQYTGGKWGSWLPYSIATMKRERKYAHLFTGVVQYNPYAPTAEVDVITTEEMIR